MTTEYANQNVITRFLKDAMNDPICNVRIAPTPSGFLHTGNAINFILNALCARLRPNGNILLRIDDIDADRKRPEYVNDIFETLHWLGISWDRGPANPKDFEDNWSQQQYIDQIMPGIHQLANDGYVFACLKSRKDLVPYQGAYPDTFRHQNLPLNTPDAAWRANTPPGFDLPCFVVRRRDGVPAYQTASVAFDVMFNISHIIRGEDLESSSTAQYWLADKAGWSSFTSVKILHHPLITDASGNKLSKSAGSISLREQYQKNESPAPIFQLTAKWLGFPEKNIQNLSDLVALLRNY